MRLKTDYEAAVTRDCVDRARQIISSTLTDIANRLLKAANNIGPAIGEYDTSNAALVARSIIANVTANIDEVELVNQMDANNELRETQVVSDDVATELHQMQMELYRALSIRRDDLGGECDSGLVGNINVGEVQQA